MHQTAQAEERQLLVGPPPLQLAAKRPSYDPYGKSETQTGLGFAPF